VGPTRRLRALSVLSALTAALLAAAVLTTPVFAALPGFHWPVQSLGNRGADVRAIQSLLRGHGVSVVYDGTFTLDTRSAVIGFQAVSGLPQTGIVDAATWEQLVTPVGPGAAREPVLTLQRQLNEKRVAGLVPTGTWNEATAAAVRAFERHVGLPVDGIADPTAWRYLVAHFDRPAFSTSSLCDYSVGNGPANWGTGAAIGQLEAAGRMAVTARLGRIPVGDVGLEHGGNIAGHATHEQGLEVDVRPVRDRRDQCRWGTNWRLSSYDRTATRALIKAIRDAAPGHVKLIYFNDPKLIAEGWTTRFTGHDDHLHVRYCEVQHPVAAYRC
jgi:peptidoglycan hydrolase-like protein with peptidoglycan-binding domain